MQGADRKQVGKNRKASVVRGRELNDLLESVMVIYSMMFSNCCFNERIRST